MWSSLMSRAVILGLEFIGFVKDPGAVWHKCYRATLKRVEAAVFPRFDATKDGIDSHQERTWWEVRDNSVKSCVPCNSQSQCVVGRKLNET